MDLTLSLKLFESFNPTDKRFEFIFFFLCACNLSIFSLLSNFIISTSGSYLSHLEYEASNGSCFTLVFVCIDSFCSSFSLLNIDVKSIDLRTGGSL
ncbi:hypothetical protein FWK35_00018411 [Aphis craccivora]|uniref:Uncharacterized protein n=1 Tax=Aphis craccivora TaxID=307492 RepID=A0A6G0YTK7_APHCR|nr:hypothetical protein FWK35_00018411 [Aphis craccivora]